MATLRTVMDEQQAEQLRGQIASEEHFLSTLVAGLPDLEIRENRAKQTLNDPARSLEHRSATTTLQKLGRQRAQIEERIAGAKYRLKVAQDRLRQMT
jgi:hypothetical protein